MIATRGTSTPSEWITAIGLSLAAHAGVAGVLVQLGGGLEQLQASQRAPLTNVVLVERFGGALQRDLVPEPVETTPPEITDPVAEPQPASEAPVQSLAETSQPDTAQTPVTEDVAEVSEPEDIAPTEIDAAEQPASEDIATTEADTAEQAAPENIATTEAGTADQAPPEDIAATEVETAQQPTPDDAPATEADRAQPATQDDVAAVEASEAPQPDLAGLDATAPETTQPVAPQNPAESAPDREQVAALAPNVAARTQPTAADRADAPAVPSPDVIPQATEAARPAAPPVAPLDGLQRVAPMDQPGTAPSVAQSQATPAEMGPSAPVDTAPLNGAAEVATALALAPALSQARQSPVAVPVTVVGPDPVAPQTTSVSEAAPPLSARPDPAPVATPAPRTAAIPGPTPSAPDEPQNLPEATGQPEVLAALPPAPSLPQTASPSPQVKATPVAPRPEPPETLSGTSTDTDGAFFFPGDGSEMSDEVRDLVNAIRVVGGPRCLVASPIRTQDGALGLRVIASSQGDIAGFRAEVAARLGFDVTVEDKLIAPLQCPALEFIRDSRTYPVTGLGIGLAADRVSAGRRLTAAVTQIQGRPVVMLLIDDNGVVQDLTPYLATSPSRAEISVPVRRGGPPKLTQQLVLALSSQADLSPLTDLSGRYASDVFAAPLVRGLSRVPMAIISVDIR